MLGGMSCVRHVLAVCVCGIERRHRPHSDGYPGWGSIEMSEQMVHTTAFAEVVEMIASARKRAFQTVNTTLIDLYWQVGSYISRKIENAEWGDGVVRQLAEHLSHTQPSLRGFTRANLFRMRQFYETYRDHELVAPLARQLSWSHNMIILGQSKRPEEREFYLRTAIREGWGKRELVRQFKTALFERTVLHPPKVSPLVRQLHPEALSVFKDA